MYNPQRKHLVQFKKKPVAVLSLVMDNRTRITIVRLIIIDFIVAKSESFSLLAFFWLCACSLAGSSPDNILFYHHLANSCHSTFPEHLYRINFYYWIYFTGILSAIQSEKSISRHWVSTLYIHPIILPVYANTFLISVNMVPKSAWPKTALPK